MDQDILHRLRLDPGQRTIGELIQDRAAAAHEILGLRRQIGRLGSVRSARKDRTEQPTSQTNAFRPGSLIRISDVCDMVGTSRSTIYRWVAEGIFPGIGWDTEAANWTREYGFQRVPVSLVPTRSLYAIARVLRPVPARTSKLRS